MGSSVRYIAAVLFIIFIGVVGTIVLIGRGRNKPAQTDNTPKTVHVADYVNNERSQVVWTQEGRLVGTDVRRAVRVTVTPSERKVELLEGYNQKVTKTAIFSNDKTAYTSFLLALENLNYGKERKVKQPDERGVCPLGSRFIYEIRENGENKLRLWSDSCVSAEGTFAGIAPTTRTLFKAQITGYEKFISGTIF